MCTKGRIGVVVNEASSLAEVGVIERMRREELFEKSDCESQNPVM